MTVLMGADKIRLTSSYCAFASVLNIKIICEPYIYINRFPIRALETGKRLKKDGHKIKHDTIKNYYNAHRVLNNFILEKNFCLILYELKWNNKRESASKR